MNSLSNNVSINLNFVIYLNNMLANYYNANEQRFPFILLDSTILLSKDEQRTILINLWDMIINSNSENIILKDVEYWIDSKFPFSNLFKQDNNGAIFYDYIKKTYECWYWGTGNRLCSTFSDNLVEQYYNEINNIEVKENIKLKEEMYYLQVTYNSPPEQWERYSNNMFIVSPDSPLPTAEEIIKKITYKYKQGNVLDMDL